MEMLDISGCKIGDDGWISISSCIHNIQKLEIGSPSDYHLTIRGVTALSEAIRKLTKPVSTRFNAGTYSIGGEHIVPLFDFPFKK